ncbi:MAG: glycosyltransferase [Fibrobacteres bacterium]|nr:glycosyltransferase [Fibrobacterota bacterium]
MPERRLAVIGHPLAAEENRLAFHGWRAHQVDLIVPHIWRARSLGHAYRAPVATQAAGDRPALHVLPVIASGRNSFFLWVGLGALLARLKPDAIYCWEEPWCLATRQVASRARALGIPFAFYSAENRPKALPWPFPALLKKTFAEARGCIVPTAAIAARARAWGYPGPLSVVPLWIRARKAMKADPGSRRIAYLGRLIPLKRVDLIVEALVRLPGFSLRIVGDGPERRRLEALARERGLSGRVEFPGHVANAELERALAGCSLLVLPTGENARQAEQFGKAALEGVTFGLPVLASTGGNLADLAVDFPTIAARDLDTPEALAQAVREIFADYPAADRLEAAKARAETGYGPAAAAQGLEKALSAMLGGRP